MDSANSDFRWASPPLTNPEARLWGPGSERTFELQRAIKILHRAETITNRFSDEGRPEGDRFKVFQSPALNSPAMLKISHKIGGRRGRPQIRLRGDAHGR